MRIYLTWNRVESDRVHRLFYPQVAVVLTARYDAKIGGMPAIWCMPLSFKPALVGVAVAPEHDTYNVINQAKAFAINFLDFRSAKQVAELGDSTGKGLNDKFSAAGFTTIKGEATGQPLLQNAEATLECRLAQVHTTGTHRLIIAEVLTAFANDSFRDYWDFTRYNPILYAGTENGGEKSWVFRSGRGEKVSVPMKIQL